jgi:hypothetical protein
MISSEVQRTLVKSPPELWAELSDPAALAGHLGELGALGDIRITRVEAEQKVEWEAGATSGTVDIKPSGWGTKVKLTVTRELPEGEVAPADEDSAEPQDPPEAAPSATRDATPTAETTAEPQPLPEPQPAPDPEAAREPEPPEPEPARDAQAAGEPEHEPAPRRGFFARLFGRLHGAQPEHAPSESISLKDSASDEPVHQLHSALAAWAPPVASEPGLEAEAEVELQSEPGPEAEPDKPAAEDGMHAEQPAQDSEPIPSEADSGISEEIRAAEEVAAEQVTAVLTGVLDRLGEAHHRPFSRS